MWYRNDMLHREDGPAVINADGSQEWWVNDVNVTEQIVMHPDSVTFDMIEQCVNFKHKSILIDLYGLDRYWNERVAKHKS